MTIPLKMPRLGETVTEGTVVRWLKKEGDFVNKDENIVEISTAKIETEIPSPTSGKVTKIEVREDETVPVDTELAEIDETARPEARPEEVRPPERAPEKAEVPPTEAIAPEAAYVPGVAPVPAEAVRPTPPPEVKPEEKLVEEKVVGFVSPIVRKLAREHNIDISQIKGTGAGGRITRQDVESYIAARAAEAPPVKPPMAAPPPISIAPMPSAEVPEREFPGARKVEEEVPVSIQPPTPVGARPAPAPVPEAKPTPPPEVAPPAPEVPGLPGERIVQMKHLRTEIAKHMVKSHQITAHVTAIVEVDMTNVVKQRDKVKESFKQREGFSLTYLPFVAKATIDALFSFPTVNARIVDEHHMALHDYVNLGIAVAVEDGLIVPVIKNADRMNLSGIARAVHDLAERTRTNKLSPDEVVGSTFTITNPGSYGSIIQTPIINQPNVAILSLELIQRRPIIVDEAIAIRHMVYMPLSYDHRLIDGALAAQFLKRVKHNLETWDFSPDLAIYM